MLSLRLWYERKLDWFFIYTYAVAGGFIIFGNIIKRCYLYFRDEFML